MNLREDDHAKSRTFLASKIQVLVPLGLVDSFWAASFGVMMNIGALAVSASLRRSFQTGFRTLSGFLSSPVEATTWLAGVVISTR